MICPISGLDYVNHEDVLPYTSTDDQPIQHELFDRFFIHDPDRGNFPIPIIFENYSSVA